jgi:hypothetical protein
MVVGRGTCRDVLPGSLIKDRVDTAIANGVAIPRAGG